MTSRKTFDHYFEKARSNGCSRDSALEYAARKYLEMVYDLHNFNEDTLTQTNLVLDVLRKYHAQRDRGRSHKEAVSHVCKWVREEVEFHIEKVSAAGWRKKDVWDHFSESYHVLPEDIAGWQSRFADGRWQRGPNGRADEHFRGMGGPPMPAGMGQYAMPPPIFPDLRPAGGSTGNFGGSPYRTEERRPGGSMRDERGPHRTASYYTEERRSGGDGSSRHASHASKDRRPGGKGGEEYTSSRYASSYTTEERCPRGHTRDQTPPRRGPFTSSQHTSYPSASSSSYNTGSRRPRTRAPSPPPLFSDYIKPATDLYVVLNLPSSATTADIKATRRKLGLLYHPDKAKAQGLDEKTATEKMREINLACDVLGDEEGRKWYDRTGTLPAVR